MKCFTSGAILLFALSGCSRTSFLISDFDSDYRPKVKTVALLSFELPLGNVFAEAHCPFLEETITRSIAAGDSRHAYVFPSRARMRLQLSNLEGRSFLKIPADRLGELFSAEALLFSEVIRLHQSIGRVQSDHPGNRGFEISTAGSRAYDGVPAGGSRHEQAFMALSGAAVWRGCRSGRPAGRAGGCRGLAFPVLMFADLGGRQTE